MHSPPARDGMYYKEFPTMFDWFHNGEGFSAFFLQGLSDPYDPGFQRRTRRYANFYLNEAPDTPPTPNYDPQHRIIPSIVNGSRGPLLRQASALDWSGDPFEIEHRYAPRHGERTFKHMLERFQVRTDVIGDHPLNMGATTLAFNAYALTGEAKYRNWALEYVDAWVERTEANGGILPTNIGLDGTIGGGLGGRWWGGIYGWGFTFRDPATEQPIHYPFFQQRAHHGFANALLLTGERRYVDAWRRTLEQVNAHAKVEGGRTLYPHMHGDQGWYEYRPEPFAPGALELYYWTLDRSSLALISTPRWIAFLDGKDPRYPEDALRQDLVALRRNMVAVRADTTTPDTRLSDEPHGTNPVIAGTLIQLMLGGLPTGRVGYPLHCRLRYFDPARRRAGLPEDVAALVEEMTAEAVTVTLVNTGPVRGRTVIVQGGAYAEHQILSVTAEGVTLPVDHSHFAVSLAPGAGGRLTVRMQRYANQPTFAFPWP